jgi:hypothetical protein
VPQAQAEFTGRPTLAQRSSRPLSMLSWQTASHCTVSIVVNTIANYDPDIIPHLEAPEGSAFERVDAGQPFVEVDFQIGE